MSWESELELAANAARKAGAVLRDLMGKDITVLSSEGKDIKLQADRDAEATILKVLEQAGYPVLAEESGEHGITGEDTPFWVVDPLDGTLNFSRGLPICCVSIALCQRDKPLLGVIYDFNRDECFSGGKGIAATVNNVPIEVSSIEEKAKAILATGFPSHIDYSDTVAISDFVAEVQAFKKLRLIGSAALSLSYVACGRLDAYAENDIMLWDIAAGAAIVQAAGGYIDIRQSERHKWGRLVRCASCPGIWS